MKMRELVVDEMRKLNRTPEEIADFLKFFESTDPVTLAETVQPAEEEVTRRLIGYTLNLRPEQLDGALQIAQQAINKTVSGN